MIELRWRVEDLNWPSGRLQYRHLLWRVDASGAVSVGFDGEWSEWLDVPTVLAGEEDASTD